MITPGVFRNSRGVVTGRSGTYRPFRGLPATLGPFREVTNRCGTYRTLFELPTDLRVTERGEGYRPLKELPTAPEIYRPTWELQTALGFTGLSGSKRPLWESVTAPGVTNLSERLWELTTVVPRVTEFSMSHRPLRGLPTALQGYRPLSGVTDRSPGFLPNSSGVSTALRATEQPRGYRPLRNYRPRSEVTDRSGSYRNSPRYRPLRELPTNPLVIGRSIWEFQDRSGSYRCLSLSLVVCSRFASCRTLP